MNPKQLVIAIAICAACSDTTNEPSKTPGRRPNPNDMNQPSGEAPVTNEQSAPTSVAPTATGTPNATNPSKTGSRSSHAADFDQTPTHDTNNNTNHGVEPSLVSPKPINTGDPCNNCK